MRTIKKKIRSVIINSRWWKMINKIDRCFKKQNANSDEALKHEQEEQDQYQLGVLFYIQQPHFVDVYEGKNSEEKCHMI